MSEIKAGDIVVANRIIWSEQSQGSESVVHAEEGEFLLVRGFGKYGEIRCSRLSCGPSFVAYKQELDILSVVTEDDIGEKTLAVISAIGGYVGKHFDLGNWSPKQIIAAALTLARSQRGPIQ